MEQQPNREDLSVLWSCGFLRVPFEYPLENAFWGGRLQSDNPEIVEAMKLLNGVGV